MRPSLSSDPHAQNLQQHAHFFKLVSFSFTDVEPASLYLPNNPTIALTPVYGHLRQQLLDLGLALGLALGRKGTFCWTLTFLSAIFRLISWTLAITLRSPVCLYKWECFVWAWLYLRASDSFHALRRFAAVRSYCVWTNVAGGGFCTIVEYTYDVPLLGANCVDYSKKLS